MKLNPFVTSFLGIIALTLGFTQSIRQASANPEYSFSCKESFDPESGESVPTTFAWTPDNNTALIVWKENYLLTTDLTAEKRCQRVSANLQEANNNGNLGIITNSAVNNQQVICTALKPQGECITVLMTLRPQDDSLEILGQLNRILDGQQIGPVKHSSDTPQVYYQIDIESFLLNSSVN